MDYSWIGLTRAQMSDETMMRSSNLLRWTHNKHHKSAQQGSSPWIHPPGALQGAHVVYLVKFLGCTEVDQAKGIEIVKAGIQKMRFSTGLKRSEGAKISKVELTISVDGVAIQDPKTKAENITLTIGQAFDLAYRRFLETSGRELEMRKQILILQKRAKLLERENMDLKTRVADLESGVGSVALYHQKDDEVPDQTGIPKSHTIPHLASVHSVPEDHSVPKQNGFGDNFHLSVVRQMFSGQAHGGEDLLKRLEPPPLPPRPQNTYSPPPELNAQKTDLITLDPFAVTITPEDDPFGDFQKLFANGNRSMSAIETNRQFDEAIGKVDKRINDMKEGFGRGLSIENGDFTLESFDPLHRSSTA